MTEPDPAPTAQGRPSALILVADDDTGFREAVRDVLLDDGFHVTEASNGSEAVTRARETPPDVVLMDLRMPGVDGIEATRRIKSEAPLIQVVMLTAYDEPALRGAAENAGAYCYLVKGCPPEMVLNMVRYALEYKQGLEGGAAPTP